MQKSTLTVTEVNLQIVLIYNPLKRIETHKGYPSQRNMTSFNEHFYVFLYSELHLDHGEDFTIVKMLSDNLQYFLVKCFILLSLKDPSKTTLVQSLWTPLMALETS